MSQYVVESGPSSSSVTSKRPYDAMVYIDGTTVIAVDSEGNTIKRGVAGTDDSMVIQSACTSYDRVYIKSGTYYIKSKILLKSNNSITGDGITTKLYTVAGFTGSNSKCIFGNINDTSAPNPTDGNISISDFYINGNATKSIGESVSGIVLRSVGDVSISDIYGEHFKYFTIFVSNAYGSPTTTGRSYNVIIENCYSNDTVYDGIAYTSDYGILKNNICTGSLYAGVGLEESSDCIVDGNISYGNTYGVRSTYGLNGYNRNNIISNNMISDSTNHGIYIEQGIRIKVANNSISNNNAKVPNTAGIYLNAQNSIVSGNSIYGLYYDIGIRDQSAAFVAPSYNMICNNTIREGNRGILVVNVTGSVYSENTIVNCASSAISFDSNPTDILIIGNIISSNVIYNEGAIFGYNQTGKIYIKDNIVADSSYKYSICLDTMSNVYVINNVFGKGTSGRSVQDNRSNVFYGNIGYVHVSEIRDTLNNTLDLLGSPRLLSPFNEITGTSITDYTRNANTLTAQANVATWHGCQGRATYYDFNGSSHYLYRTNDTDFDFGNSLTDSAFSLVVAINPDNVTSRQIIGKWDANSLREWRLFFDASGYPTLQLYDESVDKYIGRQDQTAFTTGSWKILVATYDGSGICAGCKIYIDGVQLDDADYTDAGYVAMEAINTNLMIGALKNAAAYSEYFDGKMTWIGIAAKELSPDEVWSLTQRLKGVLGI